MDERPDEQGIAHIVEHVTFLGSQRRDHLLGTGARSNAYTDFHHTVFHVHSPLTNTNIGDRTPMLPQVICLHLLPPIQAMELHEFRCVLQPAEIDPLQVHLLPPCLSAKCHFGFKLLLSKLVSLTATFFMQVLDALSEVAFWPEFLASRIEKERKAVLAEAQMMNTIEYRVDCALLKYLHEENALGCRFPIGKTEQVAFTSWQCHY